MASEEYEKGKEMGELVGQIKTLNTLLADHVSKQQEWNEKMDERVRLAEQWIQTTTGKVVVLTVIFGVVGSACYIGVNWILNHYK